MKLLWYEIRKADSKAKGLTFSGWNIGSLGIMPDTTFWLFYNTYRKSSDLRRCINEIMNTTAKKGFICSNGSDNIEDRAIIDYLWYDKWFSSIKKHAMRDLLITGNIFLLKIKAQSWKPLWLQRLDPRTMRVYIDEFWDVIKYEQRVGGKIITYTTNEIAHFVEELDPDNEAIGLSIMEGMITDVLADTEAWLTNYYFFKNGGVPGHLVMLQEWMNEDEQENAISQLKKTFGGWGKNKHKIWVAAWIQDIKKIQDSMEDMQYEILRRFTTERICSGYGVPKIILGYTEWVNYTNAENQYKKFIENTILPYEELLGERLNKIISDENVSKNKVVIVSDHIDNYIASIDNVVKQMQYWLITVNEWRQELWYEPFNVEEANQPLISRSLELLSDVWLSDYTPLNGNT